MSILSALGLDWLKFSNMYLKLEKKILVLKNKPMARGKIWFW